MQKIVVWVLGALLALVLVMFIVNQFGPNSDGGAMSNLLKLLRSNRNP